MPHELPLHHIALERHALVIATHQPQLTPPKEPFPHVELSQPLHPGGAARTAWIIAGYLALNTFGNLASTSTVEQLVLGPVTVIIAATAAIVVRHGRRS